MAEAATSKDLKETIKKQIIVAIKDKTINEAAISKLANWITGKSGPTAPGSQSSAAGKPSPGTTEPVASLGGAAPATAKAEDPKSKKIMDGVAWYLRTIQPTEEELAVVRAELSNQLKTLMNEAEQEDQFDVSSLSDTLEAAGVRPLSRQRAITVKVAAFLARHHGIKLRWNQPGQAEQPGAPEAPEVTTVKAEQVYGLDINNFKRDASTKEAYRMMWDRWKQKYRGKTEQQFDRELLELVNFLGPFKSDAFYKEGKANINKFADTDFLRGRQKELKDAYAKLPEKHGAINIIDALSGNVKQLTAVANAIMSKITRDDS
jgi:hypothetical protein